MYIKILIYLKTKNLKKIGSEIVEKKILQNFNLKHFFNVHFLK